MFRSHMLQPIAQNIYDTLMDRFSFDGIDKELQKLIKEKIIKQLSYMASESIIHVF